jgi:hypothetical protein
MVLVLVLLSPLGFYIASLRGGPSEDPTSSFPEAPDGTEAPVDPFDEAADTSNCPAARDLEEVTASTLDEQIDGVERAVERLRELRAPRVPIELLTAEEAARKLEDDEIYQSERARERDTRILEMLGVVPEGTDIEKLARELSGQIVGYYDPDEKELFVNAESKDAPLPPAGEVTLAHEMEHAIVDENFGFPRLAGTSPSKADVSLAKRALVEGDATLLTRHYVFSVLSGDQIAELQDDPTTQRALQGIQDVPPAVQLFFEFPYTQGLAFACDLYGDGGWAAIDAAYDRLPTTTAQVMYPERYRQGEGAVDVRPLSDLAAGWDKLGGSALGASDLYVLFSAPGGETSRALDDPTAAAAGWAGGTVEIWAKGKGSALSMAIAEREPEDDLCAAVHAWYRVAFPEEETVEGSPGDVMAVEGSERAALLRCIGSEVRLGIAPTLHLARSLIEPKDPSN